MEGVPLSSLQTSDQGIAQHVMCVLHAKHATIVICISRMACLNTDCHSDMIADVQEEVSSGPDGIQSGF